MSKFKNSHSTNILLEDERQATQWEKILANHIYDKGLVSKIYKELSNLNSKNNSEKTWTKVIKRHFPEKRYANL